MRPEVTVSYESNDQKYDLVFTMLSPKKSLKFLMFMGKFVGGGAGKAMGAVAGKFDNISAIKESDIDISKLGEVLFDLMDKVDEDEVEQKLDLLFSSVKLNGQSLDGDHHIFDGNPALIFKVAGKALAVNYKSFLFGNSGILKKLLKTIQVVTNTKDSPKEQT